jgi:hypothetical protein
MSQEMRVTVSDKDFFSTTDLFRGKIKDSFGAKEEIGRGLIKISSAVKAEPQPVTQWYHLGDGEWGAAEGCGKGCGRIQLRLHYRGFQNLEIHEPRDAENGEPHQIIPYLAVTNLDPRSGILVVRVLKCCRLTKTTRSLSVCCRFKCNNEVYQTKTVTTKDGKDHVCDARAIKDFYNVRYDSNLKITVIENTAVGTDEIGVFNCPVTDIANSHDINPITGLVEHGLKAGPVNLDESESGGSMWVVIRYVPCI